MTKRRALVVRGGWEGHLPAEATDLYIPFLRENGFEVTVSESTDSYLDLDGTDLVLQCVSMGEISAEAVKGLEAAVRAGTGLAGWHGGIVDSFRGDLGYQLLTGGQFLMHPPEFRDYEVRLAPEYTDHPVTAGLGDFRVRTEQYWLATDPLNDTLATTVFAAGDERERPVDMPVVWTRNWGAGRVFVSAIGHKPDDFNVAEVRMITERGLLWASR